MSELSSSPVPWKPLYKPAGVIDLGPGGRGSSLAFHVGVNVGGAPLDVLAFLQHIDGTPETVVLPGGITVERIVPLIHPYIPQMLARHVRAEGTGRPIAVAPGYEDWKVTVDFESTLFGLGGDQPFLTINRNYGGNFVTRPGTAYVGFTNGIRLRQDVGVFLPEVSYQVTLYQVPAVNDALICGLTGKVNLTEFLGRPPGTVRFDGLQTSYTQSTWNQVTFTVAFAFSFRLVPWSDVVFPDGTTDTAVNVDTGDPIYLLDELNDLLL